MQLTIQQLESRALLAGGDQEILTHIHEEVICPSGGEHGLQVQCSSQNIYDTYFVSGKLERCLDANCLEFFGEIQTAKLFEDVALVYQSSMSKVGLIKHSITVMNDGAAVHCTLNKLTGVRAQCRTIQGRIDRP